MLAAKVAGNVRLEEFVIHSPGFVFVFVVCAKVLISSNTANKQTIQLLALPWRLGCQRAAVSGWYVFGYQIESAATIGPRGVVQIFTPAVLAMLGPAWTCCRIR
jgi:hypothetical protein